MRDYSRGYTPQTSVTDKSDRRTLLSARLEASADRICDLQDCLMAGTGTLKPIEYDRLLDDYRAELVRYNNLDRELQEQETSAARHLADKERHRKMNEGRRTKIKY